MIDYLTDSGSGRISEFPHTLKGLLSVSLTNGNGIALGGCCQGAVPGCEILKCDDSYFYVRDPYYSNEVNVYDENGRKAKSISINDIDF